ncbi:uncharacterized protein LOC105914952 [Setaria italica]|uniref:uncharacterized protein LOC105914952 n=1 Tax=Setaria italica TaxID=4555 RepID=UPI000646D98F|nr:uncharacterized protein LOC105914952 [Setaria italica]
MICNVCLGKVLVDGGSGLNILVTTTFKEIGLCAMDLNPTQMPFFNIVPGDPAVPLRQITLSVSFGTIENYHTEYLRFIVADFDTVYHGILGRLALAKFMVVPHYVYMIMKMPTPTGVITVLGNVRTAYDYEKENLHQITATLELSAHMEEVLTASKKKALEKLEIPRS